MTPKRVLVLLCGSIAAYKVCQVLSDLRKLGHEVQVVASKSALQFIGAATLEGLTGRAVYSDLWENGRMMDHIELNRWADLVLVAPATANFINRASAGIADDLVGTVFLAHDFTKPYLLAPAMNQAMLAHPSTQKSLATLKSWGLQVLSTGQGNLACGETGDGRLMESADIVQAVLHALKPAAEARQKVLVTSGGTSEAIDEVRVLTNRSTGSTGATIADQLIRQGFAVTYVHAENAQQPRLACDKIAFSSVQSLQDILHSELARQPYAGIVHAAAVGDYTVKKQDGKISSEQNLTLHLERTPKLVQHLREWSMNKHIRVIAFKMTATTDVQAQLDAVTKLFAHSDVDFVIHNDTHKMSWSAATSEHHFHVFNKSSSAKNVAAGETLASKQKLASHLADLLKESHDLSP